MGVGHFSKIKGKAFENKTIFCNAGHSGATTTSSFATNDGTGFIDQNQTSATMVYPITGLSNGDVIKSFRVLGALGATTSNATVVNASLRKVTKGAGAVTDASVGAITEVSVEADTALDAEKTGLNEKVVTDYQYYVLVTGTTADNAACDISITGIEVDLNTSR
jgi:hypothetical protein